MTSKRDRQTNRALRAFDEQRIHDAGDVPDGDEQEEAPMSNTYHRMDRYGRVFRVTETHLELSARAEEIYQLALDKGGDFLIWVGVLGNERGIWYKNSALAELLAVGLFTVKEENRGGYAVYSVTYAERS